MKQSFMMDPSLLPSLAAFVAVAERGSFTAAAVSLGVSPSAVSQAVRRVEAALGVPLLARTTRSVRTTDAGRALLERAGPALMASLDALGAVAGQAGAVSGVLRLTVPRIAVPTVLGPVLPALLAAHPDLSVEVSVDYRFVDVVAGGFDAGIRLNEAIAADMIAVRLLPPFRFVIVGSPAYLNAHGVPRRPRDLVQHACIGYRAQTTGALYRWELEERGRPVIVDVSGRVVTNDAALMAQAARDGLGLGYVDELNVAADVAAGRLRVVLEAYCPPVPGLFLYCASRQRELPKVRAFIEIARRALARPGAPAVSGRGRAPRRGGARSPRA